MAKTEATPQGFKVTKDDTDIKKDQVAAMAPKPSRTPATQLDRIELMLELICTQLGIKLL